MLCVVETFLRGNETINVPGYTFYGHNRTLLHNNARRGSGGVGAFVKNELQTLKNVSVLDDNIEDILWLKLSAKVECESIVLCVCYLPPADSSRHVDSESFYCNLLEQVYAYQNMGHLYICGDMNSRVGSECDYIEGVDDVTRREVKDHTSNSNGDILIDFLVDCGICIVNGRVGTDEFTYVSPRGSSVVDYVLTPYEQLQFTSDFKVTLMTELASNMGMEDNSKIPDHSMLTWVMSLPSDTIHRENDTFPFISHTPSRTYFDTSRGVDNFLSDPDTLTRVHLTIDKIEHELDNESNVTQAYTSFLDMLSKEMELHFPKRSVKAKRDPQAKKAKSMYKPYWSDTLQKQWDIVCAKEKSWLRANAPQKRPLREQFYSARKEFDKMNRKAKRAYQLSEQTRIGDLGDSTDSRSFWKEIGKIGIQNDRKRDIPMEVIDQDGNVSNDVDVVLSRWKSDYASLYNDSDTSDHFDDAHLQRIKSDLHHSAIPSANRDVTELNCPITLKEVETSVLKAKVKGAPGLDNVSASVLRNRSCITALHKIISYCFQSGTVPADWARGLIKPIPKPDSKDPRDPLGYRGITLISIPCKIYADVLNVRVTKWLETHNILTDEQNGFRRKRSCNEHMYTLYTLINKRKFQKRSTFVCFVDAKKAFDRVQRDCLWYKLFSIGIHGKILNAIQSLYDSVTCAVKVNEYTTPFFDVSIGLKQGCKISPTLFSIYVNDLADRLKSLNCGIDIDGYNLCVLLYADDIAIIAPNEESLQTMLNEVNNWCCKWRMTLNQNKTKVIHFRPVSIEQTNFSFTCGSLNIDVAQKYKYLGLWFTEDLDMKFAVSELAKSAGRALSAIYTKYLYLGGMNYKTFTKLYESLVEPVLYYASSVWGLTDYSKIKTLQNKACRLFLGLGKNAANTASQGDMGWSSCFVKQKIEVCRQYSKLRQMSEHRTVKMVFNWSSSNGKCWERRVKKYFDGVGLGNLIDNERLSIKTIIKQVKVKLLTLDREKWYSDLFNDRNNANGNKLRTYRLYKTEIRTENYVTSNMPRHHRSILAKFRSGSLPLFVETGRYNRVPLTERICKFCNSNEVESEVHFLLFCDLYTDLRRSLLHKAHNCNSDFVNMETNDKLIFLMNHVNLTHVLSSSLYDMYRRRKQFL
ncbi:MAG: reverse transcriptase family protein [Sedimenticola sp.]